MIRKYILTAAFVFVFLNHLFGQVLNTPEIIQEQDQWCWAGVSKSILDYYGYHPSQCEIAEYARNVITWRNFGSVNCCLNPNSGCNYWNYNWGYPGSIQDILVHFGNIQNSGTGTISLAQIATQINAGRPIVVRWGWNSGGGHFVVGHGINGNNVYYMNPWFGEGLHISTYDWLKNDGVHTWTHTNVLSTSPLANEVFTNEKSIEFYPNPVENALAISSAEPIKQLRISNLLGEVVYHSDYNLSHEIVLDASAFPTGVYMLEIITTQGKFTKKLIKN
jgi:hypothetical protein